MDRKFYNDDFERMLKENADDFRMYPSKRVWHSLYNNLHPDRKWPSVAMSMLLIFFLLTIGYLHTKDSSNNKNLSHTSGSSNKNNTTAEKSPTNNSSVTGNNQAASVSPNSLSNFILAAISANKTSSTTSTDLTSINAEISLVTVTNKRNPNFRNNSSQQLISVINTSNSKRNNSNTNLRATESNSGNSFSSDYADNTNLVNRNLISLDKINLQNNGNKIPDVLINSTEDTKTLSAETLAAATNQANNKKLVSLEDKSWMEDFILHNKVERKRWKNRLMMEFYATPSFGFRNFSNNISNEAIATNLTGNSTSATIANQLVNQKPALGLEAGAGLSYSLSKNILLKAAAQLNYTSYAINADETNHPVQTTLLLNDIYNGTPYLSPRSSTISNSSGLQPITLHNKSYQFSLPVTVALKLAGNSNMSWYVGASVQPTFVIGGSAYLISADYKNYIADPSLLRRWNMNTGFETYFNYKMRGYTLQIGPQFRYQLFSTYSDKYIYNEHLYNMGLKIGFIKAF